MGNLEVHHLHAFKWLFECAYQYILNKLYILQIHCIDYRNSF